MYNLLLNDLVQLANSISDMAGSATQVAILKPLTAAINEQVGISHSAKKEVTTKYADFTAKYIKDGKFNYADVAEEDKETAKTFTQELIDIDKLTYTLPGFEFGDWFLQNLSLNDLSLLYIATSETSVFPYDKAILDELQELKERFIASRNQ